MARSQMKLRLPVELKNWIQERATKNMRPMNSEVTLLLQAVQGQIMRKETKKATS